MAKLFKMLKNKLKIYFVFSLKMIDILVKISYSQSNTDTNVAIRKVNKQYVFK